MTDADQEKIVKEAQEAYKNGTEADKLAILKGMQSAGQKWLTNDEFKKRFEFGKEIAQDRGDDELSMQFWIYGTHHDATKEEDREVVMPVMFADWEPKDDAEKMMMMKGLGIKFAEQFPHHMLTTIVHISEAWMVKRDADHPKEDDHIMPSKSPNRVEIVMVHALSMDQRQSWWQAEIKKDKDGKFTGLETIIEDQYDPENPQPANKSVVDRLSIAIMMGNGLAKRQNFDEKEDKNGKAG